MLNAVLAAIALGVLVAPYGFPLAYDLWRRARGRPDGGALSETERLEAVRRYAAWVRDMPPAPVRARPTRGAVAVPPVVPPVRGVVHPYPGRRLIGK